MPTFQLAANDYGPTLNTDCPDGGSVFALCDNPVAPILFSCRDAKCGICRIEILEGVEHLEPAKEAEVALLKQMRAPEGQRLACQAVLKAGPGAFRAAWRGDQPLPQEQPAPGKRRLM